MQDRYVGDVGDYAKYGLLRALSGALDGDINQRLSLGVVWCLVPNEGGNADGKHRGYLKSRDYEGCDEVLFKKMQELQEAPSIALVESRQILPIGTAFFNEQLDFGAVAPRDRANARSRWTRLAIDRVRDRNIVFVDPDNGLAKEGKCLENKGPKYVSVKELQSLVTRNQTLVAYHHLCRQGTHEQQIGLKLASLSTDFSSHAGVRAVWFRRGTSRVFFVIIAKSQELMINRRLDIFQKLWGKHLGRYALEPMARGQLAVSRLRGTATTEFSTDEVMAFTRGKL